MHWTNTGPDAPPPADAAPADGRPDYVDAMLDAFAQAHATEVGVLGWADPPSDGTNGGDARTDVYLENVGASGLYGSATREPNGSETAAYLTLDNDYAAADFPSYGGNFLAPLQVTAAHEYNHALQFGYDPIADLWMSESTATWMEEKVFPAVDDYHFYMSSWAGLPALPITEFDNDKVYGSAIWNHWLDRRFGADVIRAAWERSAPASFAPGAYDSAIKAVAPASGFAQQLIDFSVATAEWDAPNSGVLEGASFPRDVVRAGGVPPAPFELDHTAYALFDVPPSSAPALDLTGSLPAGTAGAVGLVGFDGNMTTAVATLLGGGQGAVTLPNPGRFSRITAVAVNADATATGFSGSDWIWARDNQLVTLAVTAQSPPVQPPAPPPAPPAASPLKLRTGTLPRLGRLARTGILAIIAEVTGPGRLRARATVDRATARRLKVGRRTTTVGTGSRTVSRAGRATLRIKLTKKARKGLRRQRRTLRIRVRTTFTPSGGAPVTRTLSVLLRP